MPLSMERTNVGDECRSHMCYRYFLEPKKALIEDGAVTISKAASELKNLAENKVVVEQKLKEINKEIQELAK